MACPAFLDFSLFSDVPFDRGAVRLHCNADFFTGLLVWPKRAYVFFLEYIQEKTHTPFLPSASFSAFCLFSYALNAIPVYPLKSFSCNSAPLSSPLRSLPSIYFWTIAVIYNSAGL